MGSDRNKIWYGIAATKAYLIFGVLQILFVALDWESFLFPSDMIGGFVLLVIGGVFLYGVKELSQGIHEGVAYIYVGIFLGLLFGLIYLLMMGANAVEAYGFQNEDFATWTPLDDLRPGLYLCVVALIGLLVWRDKFSLKKLSRAGV